MKKLFALLLAGAMLILPVLTGCGDEPAAATTTVATTEAPAVTDPPVEPASDPKTATYDSITLDGVALSEFSIVYAPDAYEQAKISYPNSFLEGETHFDKLIAEELAEVLKNMTGVELSVIPDTEAESAHEILIGKTSRAQSEVNGAGMSTVYNYRVSMKEGKLCINGGSSAATYHALDELYAHFAEQGSKSVNVAGDYTKRSSADLITVACIGDSITEGVGCSNGTYCSYPAILQRILWKDYIVINYGVSGKTMREDLTDAYIKTNAYTGMLRNAKQADITLIMLGTNDSNRDQNWNDASSAKYEEAYRNLLNEINKKNPKMTYFMMNCPVYSGNGAFGSRTVRNLQKQLTDTLIGEGWDLHFFDMYTYTKDVVTLSNFPDGLHPGDKGYGILARGVADMLEEYRASAQ
ncbi:MAG: hypothetical protein IJX47_07605 [Clostridia bacterium]|nr:hypothetical protein [Clostridia bacterium]